MYHKDDLKKLKLLWRVFPITGWIAKSHFRTGGANLPGCRDARQGIAGRSRTVAPNATHGSPSPLRGEVAGTDRGQGDTVILGGHGGDEVRGFVEVFADVTDGIVANLFGAGTDGHEGQVLGEAIQAGVPGVSLYA